MIDGVDVLDGVGVEVTTETFAVAKIARLSTATGAGLGAGAATTDSFGVAGVGTICGGFVAWTSGLVLAGAGKTGRDSTGAMVAAAGAGAIAIGTETGAGVGVGAGAGAVVAG